MHLIDSSASLIDNVDGLCVVREQDITSDLLDGLASARLASSQMRSGDNHMVAEIPTSVADIWMRQGFDVFREGARSIVKRLRATGLDAFIATNKTV